MTGPKIAHLGNNAALCVASETTESLFPRMLPLWSGQIEKLPIRRLCKCKEKIVTQISMDVLRKSLHQVDRERKRTKLLLFGLFAMTFAFWVAMMFAKDDHTGLPFGLAVVMGSVFVAGWARPKLRMTIRE